MADSPLEWPIEIVRSKRRKKSVSAELVNGVMVVRAPAHMSNRQLQPVIDNLKKRLQKKTKAKVGSDGELANRAKLLNKKFFDNKLKWQSIRFVSNQNKRYGSCTPAQGTIRISDRLAKVPQWVLDYVIVHELAHLIEANHGKRFWDLCNRYPLTERARGYLMAMSLENVSGEIE